MKTVNYIEDGDLDREFGMSDMDTVAAAIYTAFHGECQCASHPFHWDDAGHFHGWVPWEPDEDDGDYVVRAFRLAAVAAYDSLKASGVGSLE